jgi:type IV secretion system protein VirD4
MERKPHAKNKVVFLIDEAAALGKIVRLPDWLATLRKYRVAFWTIWQTIGQVADLYGKGWQTLIGNCGLLQILGIGDLETAEHTEKLLGQATVASVTKNRRGDRSVSQTGRPLLRSDELRRLKEQYQIVVIGNLPPMLLRKTPYWERSELAGRFHPNPYRDGPTRGRGSGDLWGRLYYMLVCLMAPHPLAACIVLSPIVFFLLNLFGGGG